MNKQDRIKELRTTRLAELEDEQSKLSQELDILEFMPHVEGIKSSVHVYPLHGTICSIKYGDSFRDGKLTAEQLIELSEALAGYTITRRFYVKSGCASFRAEEPSENFRCESVQEVSSFIVGTKYAGMPDSEHLELSFYVYTPMGTIEVEFITSNSMLCGLYASLDVTRGYKGSAAQYKKRCTFDASKTPHDHLDTAQTTQWASDRMAYANYTLRFVKHDPDIEPTVSEFIKAAL